MTKYTGQLIGGPDNGNLITSTVEKVPATGIVIFYPDGSEGAAVINISTGFYFWNGQYFNWVPQK